MALDEVPDQARDVVGPIAKRRQRDGKHAEPVIEVGPEPPLGHGGFEVDVGGGDDPHVDAARPRRSDALEFPLLQHAQQLGLELGLQIADFVEEDRAAVSQLEAPLPHRRRHR